MALTVYDPEKVSEGAINWRFAATLLDEVRVNPAYSIDDARIRWNNIVGDPFNSGWWLYAITEAEAYALGIVSSRVLALVPGVGVVYDPGDYTSRSRKRVSNQEDRILQQATANPFEDWAQWYP